MVDTGTARRIIARVQEVGARRIVFTGGDPLLRADTGMLMQAARGLGLEVALSTTGDRLSPSFLDEFGPCIDLISLPLDGSTEEINARTKKAGHFAAILQALDLLRAYPTIDVKLCTPVTRANLADVPNILVLAEAYAGTTQARIFFNVFQVFPRSMSPRDWSRLLVSPQEFAALEQALAARARIRVNLLDHATLDRLYCLIFPDGQLVIPRGPDYLHYGPFLEVIDLQRVIEDSQFDTAKHLRHSSGWQSVRTAAGAASPGPPPGE